MKRTPKPVNRKGASIRVLPALWKRLKEHCRVHGRVMQSVLDEIISEYLERNRNGS